MAVGIELAIRGGMLVDGLGAEPRVTDIGVADGRVVALGADVGTAAQEIDARGKLVTPGFIDVHTHYDGQAIWNSSFSPASWNGVTTVVMGNCGVGFAPVKPDDHECLVELMEGVEDIPGVALHEGLSWQWESFPEYLQALERRRHDIDFVAQLPHAPLRVYVMGERALRLEPATDADIAVMRRLAREAVEAGAGGFSTSRSINHRSSKDDPTPSLRATEAELTGIAMGLADAGRGVLQMICDFDDPETLQAEFAMMRRIVEKSGRPLSFSLMQKHGNKDGWKTLLALTEQAVADGLPMRAQVAPRGVGVLLSLQGSRNVFSACPSYQKIADLPLPQKVALMREPVTRQNILDEARSSGESSFERRLQEFENVFVLGNPPEYDPGPQRSIAALAQAQKRDPAEMAYDYLLQDEGRAILYSPFANYADVDLEACGDMLAHPDSILGLGDGGAHVGLISDASFHTFALTHWLGRQHAGRTLDLPWLVKKLTWDSAQALGLADRGCIALGKKADLNIIELDRVELGMPEMVFDLPAGKGRFLQKPSGYRATIVSGHIVYQDGQFSGAMPGRLVRDAGQNVPGQ